MTIQEEITNYLTKHSLSSLWEKTHIDVRQIKALLNYSSNQEIKFTQRVLDRIYHFFWLDKDDFYRRNLKKRYKPTEAILGNIFRHKRIELWYSLKEIAYMLKWDERQLRRIESWDSLPWYSSYYITQLIKIYWFNQNEAETIRWFICILSDMVKINNKYDLENVDE